MYSGNNIQNLFKLLNLQRFLIHLFNVHTLKMGFESLWCMCCQEYKFWLHYLYWCRQLYIHYEFSKRFNYLNAIFPRHLKIKKHVTYRFDIIFAPPIVALNTSQVNLYGAVNSFLPIIAEFTILDLVQFSELWL